MVNVLGAVCGIAFFYGLKNGLGGLSDMFMSLSGKYVYGYPHSQVPLINAFYRHSSYPHWCFLHVCRIWSLSAGI